jgi:hypothetical protein
VTSVLRAARNCWRTVAVHAIYVVSLPGAAASIERAAAKAPSSIQSFENDGIFARHAHAR